MNNLFSFKRAYESLPANKKSEVRAKIMSELSKESYAFYQRMNGRVEPKVSEAQKIEAIFAEYGITEVWNIPVAEPVEIENYL
ncbi:MAG: hypothetical protein LBI45_07350 [Bacteroidales bacterium]|jgi:hypothetical protein|nr:hypothetical protein [Bacteroidales bacterium]